MDTAQIVAASIGGFLILLLLGLVFWRRNLTAAEYTFARIVLALAIACLSVVLTGFLKVQFRGGIQAGGGFGVFIIVYFLTPARLRGTPDWQQLRELWHSQRHLEDKPEKADPNAVARELDAVNKTAGAIEKDDSLLRPFTLDHGNNYCVVYGKLLRNCYPVHGSNSTSDAGLSAAARRLAEQIPHPK